MDNHIPHMSLSDVVSEYCLGTMNDRRKYFLNYMVHAKWIWKELFQTSIYSVKSKYMKVDKTNKPYSIIMPKDNVRFINVSVEDECGKLMSLNMDDNINDFEIPTGYQCKVCGDTDLAPCVSSTITTTKPVVINGTTYIEKIWKKICPNGDILEIKETPVLDYEETEPTIKYITSERLLVNLETKSCGCVVNSQINRTAIISYCGDCIPACANCNSSSRNGFKVSNEKITFNDNVPDWVILSHQTNGECGEEDIMIPEYAVEAMTFGIGWRSVALNPARPYYEKNQARKDYDSAVQRLDEFLRPIRVEEFMNVQMSLPKWGVYGKMLQGV